MTHFTYNDTSWNSLNNVVLSVKAPPTHGDGSNIVFYAGQNEMLKVASDGFYVRGKKLNVDDKEAESVYRAFRQFLIWSALVKE